MDIKEEMLEYLWKRACFVPSERAPFPGESPRSYSERSGFALAISYSAVAWWAIERKRKENLERAVRETLKHTINKLMNVHAQSSGSWLETDFEKIVADVMAKLVQG